MLGTDVAEAQNNLIAAIEKERSASEKLMDLTMRLGGLESQVSTHRQEKARLQAELEIERAKVEVLEEANHTWVQLSFRSAPPSIRILFKIDIFYIPFEIWMHAWANLLAFKFPLLLKCTKFILGCSELAHKDATRHKLENEISELKKEKVSKSEKP